MTVDKNKKQWGDGVGHKPDKSLLPSDKYEALLELCAKKLADLGEEATRAMKDALKSSLPAIYGPDLPQHFEFVKFIKDAIEEHDKSQASHNDSNDDAITKADFDALCDAWNSYSDRLDGTTLLKSSQFRPPPRGSRVGDPKKEWVLKLRREKLRETNETRCAEVGDDDSLDWDNDNEANHQVSPREILESPQQPLNETPVQPSQASPVQPSRREPPR